MTETPNNPLDPSQQTLAAYAEMGICNPLSVATLDKALAQARLRPGARALDLGCGNAVVSRHLAERHGLQVEALERSPAVSAIARDKLAGLAGPGSVTLHRAASPDWLPTQAPFPLITALGVSAVVTGAPDPPRVFAALRPHVTEGGWLLWGDPFYRKPPSDQLRAVMGSYAAYLTHAENIEAGEAAGFTCTYAIASSEQDWDDFTWSLVAAAERWLLAHPDHPEAATARTRARLLRAAYLAEGRDAIGFGLYLFRAT